MVIPGIVARPAAGGGGGGGGASIIQSAISGTTSTTSALTTTLGATATSGNLLIAVGYVRTKSWTGGTMTPGTWTQRVFDRTATMTGFLYTKTSDGTETSATITKTGGNNRHLNLAIIEIPAAFSFSSFGLTRSQATCPAISTTDGSILIGFAVESIGDYTSTPTGTFLVAATGSVEEGAVGWMEGDGTSLAIDHNFTTNGNDVQISAEFTI